MSRIQLYAELLLHIQSISFFASLDTEHNKSTKASFSTDGETIVLSHEGDTASIRLPMKIDGAVSAPLTLPTTPAKEFSHRFKLTDKSRILLQIDEEFQNVVPWTADSLDESKTISCRQCGNYLVKQSQISNWKNLPNENWAEMMEFWHCHKPSPQHETSHGNVANSKGYGDTSKLRAVPGTGFTDLTTLLISADDLKYEKVCLPIECEVLVCSDIHEPSAQCQRREMRYGCTKKEACLAFASIRGSVSDTNALNQLIDYSIATRCIRFIIMTKKGLLRCCCTRS